jgi:hypothetical protein
MASSSTPEELLEELISGGWRMRPDACSHCQVRCSGRRIGWRPRWTLAPAARPRHVAPAPQRAAARARAARSCGSHERRRARRAWRGAPGWARTPAGSHPRVRALLPPRPTHKLALAGRRRERVWNRGARSSRPRARRARRRIAVCHAMARRAGSRPRRPRGAPAHSGPGSPGPAGAPLGCRGPSPAPRASPNPNRAASWATAGPPTAPFSTSHDPCVLTVPLAPLRPRSSRSCHRPTPARLSACPARPRATPRRQR